MSEQQAGVQTYMPVSGDMEILGALVYFLRYEVQSEQTRRAYKRHLTDAFEWLGWPNLAGIRLDRLGEWRERLKADGRGEASHAQALAAMRSFLGWAQVFGGIEVNQAALARVLRTRKAKVVNPYTVLTRQEVQRLLEVATTFRDRAFLMLLVGAGLRVSEACSAKLGDITPGEGGLILLVHGKGGHQRLVPLSPEVVEALEGYLLEGRRVMGDRQTAGERILLAEDRGAGRVGRKAAFSEQGARKALAALAKTAGLARRVTPHALRHTFAIEALRRYRDVAAVQELLGHADIRTTVIYLRHLDLGELRQHLPSWGKGAMESHGAIPLDF